MSTIATFPATAQFGSSYAGLPLTQVTGRLTDNAFTTVSGPYHPDAEKGFGTYVFEAVDVPDTWGGGFWMVSADGGTTEIPAAAWPGQFGLPRTGLGEQLLTVSVVDAADHPVSRAGVTVLSQTGAIQRYAETDSGGGAVLGVKPGTYTLAVTAGLATTTQTITISTANLAVTVTVNTPTPTPPAVPGMCALLIRVRDGAANLVPACSVTAQLSNTDLNVSDALLTQQELSGVTGADGTLTLRLIQGLPYTIRALDPDGKSFVWRSVTMPAATSANLWELV